MSAGNGNLVSDGLAGLRVPVGYDNPRAVGSQCQRARPADPGTSPGDKHNLSLQGLSGSEMRGRPNNSHFLTLSRRWMSSCAVTSKTSDTASTIVPIALISGVTPRRIDEKT